MILYFCLQHTAAHKRTSLPLQKPGPPVRSLPLLLPPSSPPHYTMLLHRMAPAAARRPASSPAAPKRKVQGGGGRRGAPGGQREDAWREEEAAAGAVPARCCLTGPLACAAAVLAPGPGLSRRGGARGCRREVERRDPCRRRGGPPNPGEGGGRAAGGARPAMATAWARAGGSAVPP